MTKQQFKAQYQAARINRMDWSNPASMVTMPDMNLAQYVLGKRDCMSFVRPSDLWKWNNHRAMEVRLTKGMSKDLWLQGAAYRLQQIIS